MQPTTVQKPRADIWTALLTLSFFALVAGSVFLHLEMKEYDNSLKPGPMPQPTALSAETP